MFILKILFLAAEMACPVPNYLAVRGTAVRNSRLREPSAGADRFSLLAFAVLITYSVKNGIILPLCWRF